MASYFHVVWFYFMLRGTDEIIISVVDVVASIGIIRIVILIGMVGSLMALT